MKLTSDQEKLGQVCLALNRAEVERDYYKNWSEILVKLLERATKANPKPR